MYWVYSDDVFFAFSSLIFLKLSPWDSGKSGKSEFGILQDAERVRASMTTKLSQQRTRQPVSGQAWPSPRHVGGLLQGPER